MDIQVNNSGKVLDYLAKYLSEPNTHIDIQYNMSTASDHFRARILGSIEAVYHICGWNLHRSSRGCVFISTNMPNHDERRQLKKDILDLPDHSSDIFSRRHVTKYEDRHFQVAELTMVEYFTYYHITKEMDIEDETNDDDYYTSTLDYGGYERLEETILYADKVLPKKCTDKRNCCFKLRDPHKKPPVWRTVYHNVTDGEAFFYQQVILHYSLYGKSFEDAKDEATWQELFFDICDTSSYKLPSEEIEKIKDLHRSMLEDQRTTAQQHFQYLYAQCSDEQTNVFETIMNTPFKLFRVLGSAGTGKSFLLKLLSLRLQALGIMTVILAPTGIAAYTVGGQTIHRFFGLANTNQVSNCVRLTDFFKRHPKMALLIDEFSMISAQLLQTMSTQLSIVTDCNRPFGNLLTIFFGDIGQLPPIDHATAGHCFMSPLWNEFCYFYLKKQQRQSGVDQQMFTNVLAQIRMNNYPHYVRDFINERKRLDEDIPFHALRLFTTRNKVDQYNKHKIRLASGRLFTFPSTDVGSEPALKDTALPSILHVKIGAPVLLLDNLDVSNGWTNGTQCIIEDVDDDIIYIKRVTDSVTRGIKPITREVYKTNYYRKQYPIVLAFASTIHKVQSLTVEAVAVSLLEPFLSHGELYVACSRVKSADNLFFLGTHQINLQVGFDTAVLDALDDSDDLFK